MALIVEDGAGVVGANAYIDEAYLDSWAAIRGYDLSSYNTAQKEGAIVVASQDWIDLYHDFRGEKINPDQGLKMPTNETVYDDKWRNIAANAAYLQLQGLLLVDESTISTSGIVTRQRDKLDVLETETEYQAGTAQTYMRKTPSLDAAIKPYLKIGGGLGDSLRW